MLLSGVEALAGRFLVELEAAAAGRPKGYSPLAAVKAALIARGELPAPQPAHEQPRANELDEAVDDEEPLDELLMAGDEEQVEQEADEPPTVDVNEPAEREQQVPMLADAPTSPPEQPQPASHEPAAPQQAPPIPYYLPDSYDRAGLVGRLEELKRQRQALPRQREDEMPSPLPTDRLQHPA